MARDYYEILGISREAKEEEIRRAHRKLAREFHPDRNPGDKNAETRFKEVEEAYDVLSDKTKRAQYDQFGSVGGHPGGNGAPGGFQWGGGFGEGVQIDPSHVEDILSQFGMGGLGGRRRPTGRRQANPEPVTHDLRVPFETAALGGSMSITVNNQPIEVTIPVGVKEGQTLRLKGQGPGGADLMLKLRVDTHPYFRREENDLILTVPITVAEAALGAKIDVPTLDGTKLTVKIPPGASTGNRLRLRGKGIKGGDQFVEIKIIAPPKLDDPSRKLMEEFAQRNPQDPRTGPPWS